MSFSERYGFKPVREALQINSMDKALRNGLWNAYYIYIVNELKYAENSLIELDCWMDFFGERVDDRRLENFNQYVRDWFFTANPQTWYRVYDFLEFWSKQQFQEDSPVEVFINECNRVLEREMSAYRFVAGKITSITSEVEIAAIEEATKQLKEGWSPVTQHLRTALAMLSDRQQPDYRNSVKESISAVESAGKIIVGKPKAKLNDVLQILEKTNQLHPALKGGFDKLYAYAGDESGIRHGLIDDTRIVTFGEAKFMLVTCSAFANYLREKLSDSSPEKADL
jgi:AbiJ N-terminal domain 4